jgi:hypothetical protein
MQSRPKFEGKKFPLVYQQQFSVIGGTGNISKTDIYKEVNQKPFKIIDEVCNNVLATKVSLLYFVP